MYTRIWQGVCVRVCLFCIALEHGVPRQSDKGVGLIKIDGIAFSRAVVSTKRLITVLRMELQVCGHIHARTPTHTHTRTHTCTRIVYQNVCAYMLIQPPPPHTRPTVLIHIARTGCSTLSSPKHTRRDQCLSGLITRTPAVIISNSRVLIIDVRPRLRTYRDLRNVSHKILSYT